MYSSKSNESDDAIVLNKTVEYEKPKHDSIMHCIKLAIEEDKPIMLDYWVDSCEQAAIVGVKENGEKLLVKSEDEYTSPIDTIYNTGSEYIIVTENSIYLVSSKILSKRIA